MNPRTGGISGHCESVRGDGWILDHSHDDRDGANGSQAAIPFLGLLV